jgi:1,4-alpha-glucan branching enzyme
MESTKMERSKSTQGVTREVPFTVRAKGANEVVVTGDFTQWTRDGIRLRKGPNDEWRTVLELEPGEHQYRLVIDGNWQDDPQATKRVPNPYGGYNSVLRVPARGER